MTDMEVIRRLAEAVMHPETRALTREEEVTIEDHLPIQCRYARHVPGHPFQLSPPDCYAAFVAHLRRKLPNG